MTPLTAEQQDRAAEFWGRKGALRVARLVARYPLLGREHAWDAAVTGTMEAAAFWDPDHNPSGRPFDACACDRIKARAFDLMRYDLEAKRDARRTRPLGPDVDPPGRPAADRTFVAEALGCLEGREAALLRGVYLDGLSVKEAGAAVGYRRVRSHNVCRAALARLARHPMLAPFRPRETVA